MSEIEWHENDYEVLVYDDPGRILMEDDIISDDFCISDHYLVLNTWTLRRYTSMKFGEFHIDWKDKSFQKVTETRR